MYRAISIVKNMQLFVQLPNKATEQKNLVLGIFWVENKTY